MQCTLRMHILVTQTPFERRSCRGSVRRRQQCYALPFPGVIVPRRAAICRCGCREWAGAGRGGVGGWLSLPFRSRVITLPLVQHNLIMPGLGCPIRRAATSGVPLGVRIPYPVKGWRQSGLVSPHHLPCGLRLGKRSPPTLPWDGRLGAASFSNLASAQQGRKDEHWNPQKHDAMAHCCRLFSSPRDAVDGASRVPSDR
jgi:hypothetical protein